MRSKYTKALYVFCAFVLVFALNVVPKDRVFAVTCSGTGCNDTDPGTTGCGDSSPSTLAINYPASSMVELRKSGGCKTYWSRITNIDQLGRSFYANATIWPPAYSTSTPGPIAVYTLVYSHQQYKGTGSGTNGFNACGYVSFSYIYGPVPKSASCAPPG